MSIDLNVTSTGLRQPPSPYDEIHLELVFTLVSTYLPVDHVLKNPGAPSFRQRLNLECAYPEPLIGQLKEAHRLTEQLYTIYKICCLSKYFYNSLQGALVALKKTIVEIVSKIHSNCEDSGPTGAICLNDCVNHAFYLKVLRVYFFHKPNALCKCS
jgi:hypothetical protein